ncbi:MAG: alpha/beta fold hydrolase [Pseudomonadota bacterium]
MTKTQYISNHKSLKLAYLYEPPSKDKKDMAEIIFLSGFRSDKFGTKASFLANYIASQGYGYLRFDYSGHGTSEGEFSELCLTDWIKDTRLMIDNILPSEKPIIIIGSSMGGWIALKLLPELQKIRKTAFLGLAPAPDFTKLMMPERYIPENQKLLAKQGYMEVACDYDVDNTPYIITQKFLEDGDKNAITDAEIPYDGPVRILQGMLDDDVPFKHALLISELLRSENVIIELIKDGAHNLSRPQDLIHIASHVALLIEHMQHGDLISEAE